MATSCHYKVIVAFSALTMGCALQDGSADLAVSSWPFYARQWCASKVLRQHIASVAGLALAVIGQLLLGLAFFATTSLASCAAVRFAKPAWLEVVAIIALLALVVLGSVNLISANLAGLANRNLAGVWCAG